MIYDFHIFSIDKTCSPYKFVDILMVEILKVVEKCKIYQIKVPKKSGSCAFDKKIFPCGCNLPNFEDLPWGCQGDGNTWN